MHFPLPIQPSSTNRIPNFDIIRARVEQTIASEVPEYTAWTEKERTAWRLQRDESTNATKERIRCALVAEATGQTPDAIATTHNNFLSPPQTTLTELAGPLAQEYSNAVYLAMDGIGSDWFYLNEYFRKGEDLSCFPTVGSWDRHNHAIQQEAKTRNFGTDPEPYQGNLFAEWGRCVIDNRFSYVNLYMLSTYLYSALKENAQATIRRLVPYRYKAKPDHGTKTPDGIILSMEKDAGGLEDVLTDLETIQQTAISKITARIANEALTNPVPKVWMLRRSDDGDPDFENHYDVVFLNPTSLDAVRWTSFIADINALAADASELVACVERETSALTAQLETAYTEKMAGRIQTTYLPPSDPIFPISRHPTQTT